MRPSRLSVKDKSSMPCVSVYAIDGGNIVSNTAIFRIIFSIFKRIFLENVTGAWVSELSSPSGSKSEPSAGHVSWITIYFLIGVPELGHLFGFIFLVPPESLILDLGVSKKQDFFKKCAFSFEKMVDYARPGDQKLSSSGGPI